MGSKKKPVKANNNPLYGEVVVSKSVGLASFWPVIQWRKLGLIPRILLSALLLIIVVSIVLVVANKSTPEQKPPLSANVDNDYSDTELANLPLLLNHDYNLTENDIMHGNLHKELKTFDEAHNVAIAIARLGNRHRSLDAYKIAVSKAPKTTDDSFYLEVMGISYQMGDPQYSEQMYQKALDAVNNSNMTASEKKTADARDKALYEYAKQAEK
jgi:tetratricopeptide (TPR) repeat protein